MKTHPLPLLTAALLAITAIGSGAAHKTEDPCLAKRTKAVEGPVTQPGELVSFSSKLTGIVHGTIESSGCAYFFSKGKWVHVWVSD